MRLGGKKAGRPGSWEAIKLVGWEVIKEKGERLKEKDKGHICNRIMCRITILILY
jgi:hypothetical protein